MKNLIAIFVFITLSFLTCKNQVTNDIPWATSSWLSRTTVYLVFKNTGKEKKSIEVSYYNKTTREEYHEKLNLDIGQVDTISLRLFRPEIIDIEYNNRDYHFYLIPNKDIEVELSNSIKFVGVNKQLYSPLFEIGDHELSKADFAKLLENGNLPNWLKTYLQDSRELKEIYKIYHNAGYQQFIGVDVKVPLKDSIKAELLLQNQAEGLYHNYYTLLRIFKSNFDFGNENDSIPTELHIFSKRKKIYDDVLKIEEEEVRNMMLAIYVEGLIRKRKSFRSKEEVLNYAISKLPEEYVLQLNEIEKEYTDQNYEIEKIISLLQKDIESLNGKAKPLKYEEGNYKLLKFWFAGCAPCKKQIPYENKLLKKHKNITLLHFCHSTDHEKWKKYIIANNSLGEHYYLNNEVYSEYDNVLSLGYAPRYILLDQNNQIVCWECSNPNNNEIQDLLKASDQ